MALRNALKRELQPLNPGSPPSPIQIILQRSCLDISCGPLVEHADEETMTGALLGAIAANAAWSNRIMPAGAGEITWIRYRKASGAFDSETRTGADFGLLLRIGPDTLRLAVFQAKRPDATQPERLNVHRMAPAVGNFPKEPQFERLRRYGHEVLAAIGSPPQSDEMGCLHWIHYLTYVRHGLPTYSFDQLDEIREIYAEWDRGTKKRPASMLLTDLRENQLVFLLTSGANELQGDRHGWLSLDAKQAVDATKCLARRIPVIDVAMPGAPRPTKRQTPADIQRERFTRGPSSRLALAGMWARQLSPPKPEAEPDPEPDPGPDMGPEQQQKRKRGHGF